MPKIPKINADNEVIGETTIKEAKENEWYRRIIRVYILDLEHTHILLQKRGPNMNAFPGRWDQAVGGHVDLGETAVEAAGREMDEEIGVQTDLRVIVDWYQNSTENMFEGIFTATLPKETKLIVSPDEVAEMKWITIVEYELDIAREPDSYTPGTIHAWNLYRDRILTT